MAAPATWSGWLGGLWNSLWGPPAAGSPAARLEERRVGALLDKESAKPEGQRDEERIRQLDVEHTKLMLANIQVRRRRRLVVGRCAVRRAPSILCSAASAASSCSTNAVSEAQFRYLAG